MLRSLHIQNLAIIHAVDLEFGSGFTVLTGETGAGKSILIDALGLVVGGRADPALLRSGTERADISAEFSLADAPAARAWLAEQELDDPDQPDICLLRRVLGRDGRTRAFINGSSVSAAALRALGELLIEVFGQNEGQTLLRPDVQRAVLDSFGGYSTTLDAVAGAARAWQTQQRQIEALRQAGPRDPAQIDFLRFQLRELEALNLGDDEVVRLDAEHKRLANAERLLREGNRALQALYGGELSACDLLGSASHTLSGLISFDSAFGEADELTQAAQAQAREAAQTLKRLLDHLELDPEQLVQVERRMRDIQDMARKHRVRPEALPERQTQLAAELEQAIQATEGLAVLEQQLERLEQAYRHQAALLTEARGAAAARFGHEVTAQVRRLGMPNATLGVVLETDTTTRPRAQGDDELRFDFSANPGQAPRPLAKVASGGELSRVSLAIQVCALQAGGPATMIFDEVDAGIGGGVAEIVGGRLRVLGDQRQVFCVTHLSQVAAHGHHHLGIAKEVADGQTYTRIHPLSDDARVTELARMSGGVDVTEATRSLARELLDRAAG